MLRWFFGGKPQEKPQKKTLSVVDVGTGDFGQPIVGESRYQEQLSAIAAGRTARGERVEFRVVLVPEPSNKYDPNAVAVYAADGGIVGYLPREDAEEYQAEIAAFIKTRDKYPSCSAVMAGGRGDKKTIGVWLDINLDEVSDGVWLDIDLDEVSERGMGRQGESRVGGEVGYFGLGEWWLETFTDAERKYIDRITRSTGDGSVTRGEISSSSGSAAQFLSNVAGNFDSGEDQRIGGLMLAKAEELAKEAGGLLDLHFTYMGMIKMYYSRRETDPTALDAAITACERQIEVAPEAAEGFRLECPVVALPMHTGFTQLAIIREKQKNHAEAIRLSRLALEQGWAGDWEKRIARNQKRLAASR